MNWGSGDGSSGRDEAFRRDTADDMADNDQNKIVPIRGPRNSGLQAGARPRHQNAGGSPSGHRSQGNGQRRQAPTPYGSNARQGRHQSDTSLGEFEPLEYAAIPGGGTAIDTGASQSGFYIRPEYAPAHNAGDRTAGQADRKVISRRAPRVVIYVLLAVLLACAGVAVGAVLSLSYLQQALPQMLERYGTTEGLGSTPGVPVVSPTAGLPPTVRPLPTEGSSLSPYASFTRNVQWSVQSVRPGLAQELDLR